MSERLTYVEIDLEVCSLTHGVSPCPATGEPCFNTRKTCQALEAYDPEVQTLRLGQPTIYNPGDIAAVENISGVSYTPSLVKLGESIGARASLTVNCTDHPSPDTGAGGDPYVSQRNYDPFKRGTFWGKLRARHPYLRGRVLRWYNGRVGQTIDQMERRTFIIDTIDGPSTRGTFTIKAKDPLALTDSQRAQAPRLSRGLLAAGIGTGTGVAATLTPPGVGADYPASGKVAIGGNEICTFTRSGDVLTLTGRGINNTEVSGHDADDRVQLVLEYDGETPAFILNDLMTTYGNVPASFINLLNWEAEVAEFISRLYSGVIAEPTPVVDLINELLEQAAISVWWDELGETIRLQVLRNVTQGSFVYTDDFMLAGSFKQKDQPSKRVSQVWTYYGQINPLESLEDAKNYRNTLLSVSTESEQNWGEPAIKRIFSRWITQFARPSAERLNNLILSRYSEPPRMFEFNLLRDSGTPLPPLGSGLQIESFFDQDATGAKKISPCQAVQIKVSDTGMAVSAEEVIISEAIAPDDPTVKLVPIDADTNNFNLRTTYLQQYPEAEDGDTVICEVRGGVVVGSETTTAPAWATGTGWPSGVTLVLRVLEGAFIVGRGGAGGSANQSSAQNGGSGGPALLANHNLNQEDFEITNDGVIGGGGGGGGGATVTGRSNAPGAGVDTSASAGGGGGGGFGTAGTASGTISRGNGSPGGLESGGAGGSASASADGPVFVSATGGSAGGLGQPGSSGAASIGGVMPSGSQSTGTGGAPGNAIVGESLITWINEGDIRGPRLP